jgi:hypothetical protein
MALKLHFFGGDKKSHALERGHKPIFCYFITTVLFGRLAGTKIASY